MCADHSRDPCALLDKRHHMETTSVVKCKFCVCVGQGWGQGRGVVALTNSKFSHVKWHNALICIIRALTLQLCTRRLQWHSQAHYWPIVASLAWLIVVVHPTVLIALCFNNAAAMYNNWRVGTSYCTCRLRNHNLNYAHSLYCEAY